MSDPAGGPGDPGPAHEWPDLAVSADRPWIGSRGFLEAVVAAGPDLLSVVDLDSSTTVWTARLPGGMAGVDAVHEALRRESVNVGGDVPDVLDALTHPDGLATPETAAQAAAGLPDGHVATSRHRVLDARGEYRWVLRRSTPFTRHADGRVEQVLCVAQDVTDAVTAETALRTAALYDPLTGLPNRALLGDRLRSALGRHGRDQEQLVVMFCDLDGFKQINDDAGHAVGDVVLQVIADRLGDLVRAEDTVARPHGDEFVIVLEHHEHPTDHRGGDGDHRDDGDAEPDQALDIVAERVASRILERIAAPIAVDGRTYHLTASVGTTLAGPDAGPDDALHDADTAMYRAKRQGGNQHVIHPRP